MVSTLPSVPVGSSDAGHSSEFFISVVSQIVVLTETAVVEAIDKNLGEILEQGIRDEEETEVNMGAATMLNSEPPGPQDIADINTSLVTQHFESEMQSTIQIEELTETIRFLTEDQNLTSEVQVFAICQARSYVEREELTAAEEQISKLENELSESKAKVPSLKNSLEELRQSHALFHYRNLRLEDELRTSIKINNIKHALNHKYWDGIDFCRRTIKLILPKFLSSILHLRNSSAMQRSEILGCPRQDEELESSLPSTSGSPSKI
ncbi:hypothetical protein Nepgr_007240 [Nepenthes gracilis]|uniref:Uncharacterized protein n=1 Tax=Nepenthes gracilis TaxID=150966 RepID=A0AAD3XI63_NEPGR|nr:hypothetical protein Nepgr_007240 [Nepenthes gracilis]